MKNIKLVILFLLFSISCYGHGGGTDRQGGHMDHFTGEYHFHHGFGPHQHPDDICELSLPRNQRPLKYIRKHNPEITKHDHDDKIHVKESENSRIWMVGILGIGAGLLINGSRKN